MSARVCVWACVRVIHVHVFIFIYILHTTYSNLGLCNIFRETSLPFALCDNLLYSIFYCKFPPAFITVTYTLTLTTWVMIT